MRTATAPALKFIPIDAILRRKARISAKLADAVAALRAAEDKLGQATDEFDDAAAYTAFCEADARYNTLDLTADERKAYYDDCSIQLAELREVRYGARFYADMLDEGHAPTLQSRVFHAIASHGNEDPRNTPHVEGAIIALRLAERSLESALALAKQLDGQEIEEAYQQPFAARGVVRHYICALISGSFVFDDKKALDAIIAAKRTIAMAA